MINNEIDNPFPLAYLDWCKEVKKANTVEETERRDWIIEFYESEEWNCKPITTLDIIIALGGKHEKSNSQRNS